MTSEEVFNTFNTVIETTESSPFFKQLAKAALGATPDDKALIMRTWPKFVQNYGPGSSLYKEAAWHKAAYKSQTPSNTKTLQSQRQC